MTSQNKQQDSNLQGGQSDDSHNDSHLPECPVPEMDGLWGLPLHPEDAEINCICDRLRACEKRARAGAYNEGYVDGSKDAREGAFREAREAVVGLKKYVEFPGAPVNYIHPDFFIAAIDALREEQK